MPRIFYTAANYTGIYNHLNTVGEQHVNCRKIDLYRAIITVGNPSFFSWRMIRQQGFFRALSNSIVQKVLLVQANVESTQNGMNLHPSFHQHVSDQKRVVSYNLGMAFAKIYAEELFEITNLIHVESLKKHGAITFHNTGGKRKEPDLVGFTSDGSWHVFEAKGVSTNQLNTKIRAAKEQAREVDTIHGIQPATLSACATYLGPHKILSRIEDPESERKKKIEIKTNEFFESYYNSFFALKELLGTEPQKEKFENVDYYQHKITTNALRISIGLEEEVFELIQEKKFEPIKDFLSKKMSFKKEGLFEDKENYSLGTDGFLVRYTNGQ